MFQKIKSLKSIELDISSLFINAKKRTLCFRNLYSLAKDPKQEDLNPKKSYLMTANPSLDEDAKQVTVCSTTRKICSGLRNAAPKMILWLSRFLISRFKK